MHPAKKFKLSSSLKQLQETSKYETQSLIHTLESRPQCTTQTKHQHSFKLNPSSHSIISELPIAAIRKRSASNRLQSLNNEALGAQKFSILDHQQDRKQTFMKEKRQLLKKYNIDLQKVIMPQRDKEAAVRKEIQEEDKFDIVKPSVLYTQETNPMENCLTTTIVQTPILPCFSSQFSQRNPEDKRSKKIQQGEGVWKIGKFKVKNGKSTLTIGSIEFEGSFVSTSGKAGVLRGNNIYELPNWQGLWVMQPKESLFTE